MEREREKKKVKGRSDRKIYRERKKEGRERREIERNKGRLERTI